MIHKMTADQFGDIALDCREPGIKIVDIFPAGLPEDIVRKLFEPFGIRLLCLMCEIQDREKGRICLWQFARGVRISGDYLIIKPWISPGLPSS